MKRRLFIASAVALACGKSSAPPKDTTTAVSPTPLAASGTAQCPATGQWAECSVLYRLDRAGVAPRVDSGAKPEEKRLSGKSFVLKIGQMASLDVFLYADSAARIADEAKLDRKEFVDGNAPQTIRRERTLIDNANMIALLTSLNERQRERVANALMAGAPQP